MIFSDKQINYSNDIKNKIQKILNNYLYHLEFWQVNEDKWYSISDSGTISENLEFIKLWREVRTQVNTLRIKKVNDSCKVEDINVDIFKQRLLGLLDKLEKINNPIYFIKYNPFRYLLMGSSAPLIGLEKFINGLDECDEENEVSRYL